uniref:Uncharacterized protein n=1 Tax=Sphaerodactylus townsendi TaxID=933632 RepID=A0ACB8ESE3_9SAUR
MAALHGLFNSDLSQSYSHYHCCPGPGLSQLSLVALPALHGPFGSSHSRTYLTPPKPPPSPGEEKASKERFRTGLQMLIQNVGIVLLGWMKLNSSTLFLKLARRMPPKSHEEGMNMMAVPCCFATIRCSEV